MEKLQGKARKIALLGVIDIGSAFMQLKIADKAEGEQLKILESVTKTLPIGRETFSEGRISPEMMRALSKNLLGFRQLLREYKVKKYKVVATGAIREALNREYVIDQIKANTGFTIEMIHASQERFLTQQAVRNALPSYDKLKKEGLLIVNIGSGGVQVAAYAPDGMQYSQNINMGALRIRQLLSSAELKTMEYTRLLKEYIYGYIQELILPMQKGFRHLVITGEEVDVLYRICGGEGKPQNERSLDQAVFRQLYEKMHFMNAQQIRDEFDLGFERAEMLLPAMMIVQAFISAAGAKKVYCPSVGLSNGILYEMSREKEDTEMEEELLQYIRATARQYYISMNHVEEVAKNALLIFDHLGKKQSLTNRHRLLLEMGALLHDIGKQINLANHAQCGADLLMHMDLIGISEEEQRQLVVLVRYHEAGEPKAEDEAYKALNKKSRMAVSKLLAMLQAANALDYSHKQKLYDLVIKLKGESFIIQAFTKENAVLEEWMFQHTQGLFREVFSLEPELKVYTKRMPG